MRNTGMVIVSQPHKVIRILPKIRDYIANTLYILLLADNKFGMKSNGVKKLESPSRFSSTIINIYASTLQENLDVRILLNGVREPVLNDVHTKKRIEVVYFDQLLFNTKEVQDYVSNRIKNKSADCEVVSIDSSDANPKNDFDNVTISTGSQHIAMYKQVVLGGTFDRLHVGHKILLTEAVLHCNHKISVGVTDTEMLKSKKLWELIEPCNLRIRNVREFLEEVEPRLEYDVFPIDNLYGPTEYNPEFEMIIVSDETVKGSDKINELRLRKGLNPLKVHRVVLLPENNKTDDVEEGKISSSNLRLRLLGKLLKMPTPKPHLQQVPYLIGLTGGIASGKSGILKYLKSYGAGIINADHLAYKVYDVDTPGYKKVVEHFGTTILGKDGVIDRKVLGSIVFSDEKHLQKLNQIVWPNLLNLIKEEVKKLGEIGYKIVVIEAAVLIRAGWDKEVHEVWVTLIPPEEAIRRIQKRNNLTDDEAKKRVNSQPTNSEQLEKANTVFCSQWTHSFTEKQVLRAWEELQNRLL